MQQEQHTATNDTSKDTAQKKILLVEDNPVFSMIVTKSITDTTGHRVVRLPDGSQLLRAIDEEKPDMLILDYDLPGMNGIQLYDLVHSTQGLEHLPALMVSGNLPQQELAQRGIEGLRKPCRTSDLVQAVEAVLVKKGA